MAPRLLKRVRPLLRGRVVSGDALYCQQALCRQIHAAEGAYLFAVKANQPSLLEDVRLLFDDPPPGERFHCAQTVDAHGGRVEQRRLRASAALADYLQAAGWVGAGLILEVQTTVRWPADPTRAPRQEVRYFLSSLSAQVSARRALALVRRHWHIENRLHWPRDMTLGEDASQVRSGHAPQVLAAVRNTVVGLLHLGHVANLAAALRTHAWPPSSLVLSLLGLAPTKL